MHPTAARLAERLARRGLEIEVTTLSDSARTAPLAAEALGVEVGQIVKSLVFLRDAEPLIVLCAGDRRVASARLGLSTSIGGSRPRGDRLLDRRGPAARPRH